MPTSTLNARQPRLAPAHAAPAGLAIPPGHVGPVSLPGSGRMVWWTGRVAIGLRHEAHRGVRQPMSASAAWLQALLLDGPRPGALAG